MTEKAFSPWTPEQVKNLNDYQKCNYFHPYTCSCDCPGEDHILIATENGWVCPHCGDNSQKWAMKAMTEPIPVDVKLDAIETAAKKHAEDIANCSLAIQERDELRWLFEVQQKRMAEATKYWQEKTGRHDTWPDLGDMLKFLMDKIIENGLH